MDVIVLFPFYHGGAVANIGDTVTLDFGLAMEMISANWCVPA